MERIGGNPGAATIVYVTLQKTAEKVAELVSSKGIEAKPYHAGLRADQRAEIQNKFMAGKIPVVAATIAFGMGIDKKDIRRIIHYDLPKSIEGYSQEIGRAGRDGEAAVCEVLANRDNIHILENFIYGDTPERSAIRNLLIKIKSNPSEKWEIKMYGLSLETDIRVLPLKTLLVYLEMKGIIIPRYVYFEEYTFKYMYVAEDIIDRFDGERKTFVRSIFRHSKSAKIWTNVDVGSVMAECGVSRERVMKALEYFDEKEWIELRAAQAVDVYDIVNKDFDPGAISEDLYTLVKRKENSGIKRIHDMVDLFESKACLTDRLSLYFGEDINRNCGHCSVCENGAVDIVETMMLLPLSRYNFHEISKTLFNCAEDSRISFLTITRFLCGVNSPVLTKLRAKKFPGFGSLCKYSYKEVEVWVAGNMK